ncbi:MAG: Translation initiation factor IF-2 [Chlamydiia bacterium]|nr:Translation initiation factor IF-2 [Chlamydiia bacterium]MCH9618704.1 Translation initiation factor IF-2 [Chlamydiia bacterium]MCH9624384.1 Translation initiation factor IF-2 [Chlamydiia bacterium]
MAKNFNLKVKNSQLAAVLKQKGLKSSKKATSTSSKTAEKKPVASAAEEVLGEDAPKKILRKAKAGPTMQREEPEVLETPVEELITTELVEETEPPVNDTEEKEVIKESVEEVGSTLTVKEDLKQEIKEEKKEEKIFKEAPKEKQLTEEEIRRIELSKPIEERRMISKNKYVRPVSARAAAQKEAARKEAAKKEAAKKAGTDKRPAKETDTKTVSRAPARAPLPGRNTKVDDKKKKGMDSYKRQAFSRVFDQRGAMSREDSWRRRRNKKNKTVVAPEDIVRPKSISVKIPISVKELASELKIKGSEVIQKLFLAGFPITINDILDDGTTIELIGNEFGCAIKIDTALEDKLQITDKTLKEEISETDKSKLSKRPPIVTVMGHVDHGKTSIIDAFRDSNITGGEAGAITQHIGAFICHTAHGDFSVIDTPGHEAFTAIRSRGATLTDIIVLVIAGDEGIKPQTDEAIEKAKEAEVPIVVAINKVDKSGFNEENIYKQLADRDLLPEAWGGSVITVNCSAKTKVGIAQLAEMIALQTDVLELRANLSARARGTVLESELHKGLGVTATLLVLNGTLKIGDAVVFEHEWGKTKTMQNEYGKLLKEAHAGTPIKVTGLSGVPPAGNDFIVVSSEKEAREIATKRKSAFRQAQLKKAKGRVAQTILDERVADMKKKTINIILKADVGGSLEAVKDSLIKIPTEKVIINFVSTEVGQISESDINLAHASNSIVLGFHTKVEQHAEGLIKEKKTKIILHDVIYHMIDDVKIEMQKLLDKVRHEEKVATAKVLAVFKSSRLGNIAGSIVTSGLFKRNYLAKLIRGKEVLYTGPIASLKRMHDDVKEVKKDTECGILLTGFNDFKEEDIIEGYEVTYLEQEL